MPVNVSHKIIIPLPEQPRKSKAILVPGKGVRRITKRKLTQAKKASELYEVQRLNMRAKNRKKENFFLKPIWAAGAWIKAEAEKIYSLFQDEPTHKARVDQFLNLDRKGRIKPNTLKKKQTSFHHKGLNTETKKVSSKPSQSQGALSKESELQSKLRKS